MRCVKTSKVYRYGRRDGIRPYSVEEDGGCWYPRRYHGYTNSHRVHEPAQPMDQQTATSIMAGLEQPMRKCDTDMVSSKRTNRDILIYLLHK